MIFNKENIFNKDGFIWWIGVVEERKEDPDRLGRVKVRIMGYHSDDKEILPTEELPWAIVMQPTTSAAVSGVGHSPTAIMEGTWCVGFFIDGNDKQQPVVIGTIGGYTQKVQFCGQTPNYEITEVLPEELNVTNTVFDENGDPLFDLDTEVAYEYEAVQGAGEAWAQENFLLNLETEAFQDPNAEFPRCDYIDKPDTNKLATGDVLGDNITPYSKKLETRREGIPTALSDSEWDEPEPAYCTEYPYNIVYETESGHVVEFDSTPGHERIHLYHREGTYIEIDANSTMVRKVVGDNFEIVENNSYLYVKGAYKLTVDDGVKILVNGKADIEVNGTLDAKVSEDVRFEVGGSFNVKAPQINLEADDINIKGGSTKVEGGSLDLKGGTARLTGGTTDIRGGPIRLNGSAASAADAGPAEGVEESDFGLADLERLDCFLEEPEYPEDPEPEDFIVESGEGITESPEQFAYVPVEGEPYTVATVDAVDVPIGDIYVATDLTGAVLQPNATITGNFNLDNLV